VGGWAGTQSPATRNCWPLTRAKDTSVWARQEQRSCPSLAESFEFQKANLSVYTISVLESDNDYHLLLSNCREAMHKQLPLDMSLLEVSFS